MSRISKRWRLLFERVVLIFGPTPAFETDGDKKEPLFQHGSRLYRHARWQYYRFLYTLHGIHKDIELLKQRVREAVSPVIMDQEQRLAEMDTFLTAVLDIDSASYTRPQQRRRHQVRLE
jgi:hypothetical protein